MIPGLPERLRKAFGYTHDAPSILTEAADEIENLRHQVDEQNALLRELNDALVIPGWLQPRVDALLDLAEPNERRYTNCRADVNRDDKPEPQQVKE